MAIRCRGRLSSTEIVVLMRFTRVGRDDDGVAAVVALACTTTATSVATPGAERGDSDNRSCQPNSLRQRKQRARLAGVEITIPQVH
jgi:hypothetical protein